MQPCTGHAGSARWRKLSASKKTAGGFVCRVRSSFGWRVPDNSGFCNLGHGSQNRDAAAQSRDRNTNVCSFPDGGITFVRRWYRVRDKEQEEEEKTKRL